LNALEHLLFILSRRIEETGGSEEIGLMVGELLTAVIAVPQDDTEPMMVLNDGWAQRYQSSEYPSLYVMHTATTGYYKIGKANVPLNRLRNLQTGNPFALTIVHRVSGSDPDEASRLEARVHEILDPHHLRGEWFNCPLDQIIDAIRQASHEDIDGPVSQ
jgi:hypothetical protein